MDVHGTSAAIQRSLANASAWARWARPRLPFRSAYRDFCSASLAFSGPINPFVSLRVLPSASPHKCVSSPNYTWALSGRHDSDQGWVLPEGRANRLIARVRRRLPRSWSYWPLNISIAERHPRQTRSAVERAPFIVTARGRNSHGLVEKWPVHFCD